MQKPSDVFLGVIEFFAVLLPGALVTWMLWRWPWPMQAEDSGPFRSIAKMTISFLPRDPIARWVAFAVVSWGVGQVLFAFAPPIDWAWDWVRHYKRVKNGKLTEPADKAVVALRCALLGLSFPAGTDLPSHCFERAARATVKTALVIATTLLIAVPAAYIVFDPTGCLTGSTCTIRGFAISISVVILAVLALSCGLTSRKKLWKPALVVAEKEATREHGDWAEQYLRQVNIASLPASVPLSAIKGAAKDTEEAARKLQQIVNQSIKTKENIQQPTIDKICELLRSASQLQQQAGLIQQAADSAYVPLAQAADAAISLQQANDAVEMAEAAIDSRQATFDNARKAVKEARSRRKQAVNAAKAVAKDTEKAAERLEQTVNQLEKATLPSAASSAQLIQSDELKQTASQLRDEAIKLNGIADSALYEKIMKPVSSMRSAQRQHVREQREQAAQANDPIASPTEELERAKSRLAQATEAAKAFDQAKEAFAGAWKAVEEAKSRLGGGAPNLAQTLRRITPWWPHLRAKRKFRSAKRRGEEAKARQIKAVEKEQVKKGGVNAAVSALKLEVNSTKAAVNKTIEAYGQVPEIANDLPLQAAVVAVHTTFASVAGGTEPAIRRVEEFPGQKRTPSLDTINNYDFACSVLRARAPAALAEVEKLQAQSKLFRSLTTGIFFISYLFLLSWAIRIYQTSPGSEWPKFDIPTGVVWGMSLTLSILLYNRMRKKAVDEAYQSAVVAFAFGARVESGAAVKGGVQG